MYNGHLICEIVCLWICGRYYVPFSQQDLVYFQYYLEGTGTSQNRHISNFRALYHIAEDSYADCTSKVAFMMAKDDNSNQVHKLAAVPEGADKVIVKFKKATHCFSYKDCLKLGFMKKLCRWPW